MRAAQLRAFLHLQPSHSPTIRPSQCSQRSNKVIGIDVSGIAGGERAAGTNIRVVRCYSFLQPLQHRSLRSSLLLQAMPSAMWPSCLVSGKEDGFSLLTRSSLIFCPDKKFSFEQTTFHNAYLLYINTYKGQKYVLIKFHHKKEVAHIPVCCRTGALLIFCSPAVAAAMVIWHLHSAVLRRCVVSRTHSFRKTPPAPQTSSSPVHA